QRNVEGPQGAPIDVQRGDDYGRVEDSALDAHGAFRVEASQAPDDTRIDRLRQRSACIVAPVRSGPRARAACRWAAALFLIGAGLGGCGGSDGANPPAGNSGVSASQDLAPLTVAQIRRVPQTDPFSAVVRLWFWVQWGSAPNLVGAYDPTVVRVAGPANLASVYAGQRATFLS